MLLLADWVVPVSRPPIPRGGVLIHEDTVVAVGRAQEFAHVPESETFDLGECLITPGLVNAHTHLALSAMHGLFAPAPFTVWLPRLVTAMRAWGPEDYEASMTMGIHECFASGVTVVGDITYGSESLAAARREGLAGIFYRELLGMDAEDSAEALEAMLEDGTFNADTARVVAGISPHSVYGSGPGSLRVSHEFAVEHGIPLAIHVAESGAETELTLKGSGPLADVAGRLAMDFSVPSVGPLEYLDRVGVLDDVTAIHVCEATPAEVIRLASAARGVVTCPRSNSFLLNRPAPLAHLMKSGVPVGVGTDSSASNDNLDLCAELRAIAAENPSIPFTALLEMATVAGAKALGLDALFGSLAPGKQADIAAFRIRPTDEPIETFIRTAGQETLDALISAGEWRIREGVPVEDLRPVRTAARASRIRAQHALDAF